jgi:hypothetical protein
VFCHVLTLWILFENFFGDPLPRGRAASQVLGGTVIVLIAAAFYRAWMGSGRYLSFREEFQAETDDQRQVRSVYVVLYAVLSFLLPVVLMFSFAK